MIGRIFIGFILSGILMGVAVGELMHVRIYTPDEVEGLAAYESAPVSPLVAAAKPPEKPPQESFEIAEAIRKTVGDRAKSLGKAYAMDTVGDLNIGGSDHTISVGCQGLDNALLSLEFNREGSQVIHALVQSVRLEEAATPALLEKRFSDFHRRAFGFDPPAERPADDRVQVERSIQAAFAQWRITADGALVGEAMISSIPDQGTGLGTMLGYPCPTPAEVAEVADWLRKQPTRITKEEAVAIAWKNWKAVRSAADGGTDYQIMCQLRKGLKEEREPWGVYGCIHDGPKAWKNPAAVSDSPDPVFYELKITKGFFTVSVLVDRRDGKVIRIHQGERGW